VCIFAFGVVLSLQPLSLSLSHDSVSGFTEFATRAAAMVAANIRDERVFARLKEHKGT
jgi:hypothetical protein